MAYLPPGPPGQVGDYDWVSQASIARCESEERCHVLLISWGASNRAHLPRAGGLRGDGDLAVSALSGVSPRMTTASRLGRAYSMIRSGGVVGNSSGRTTPVNERRTTPQEWAARASL